MGLHWGLDMTDASTITRKFPKSGGRANEISASHFCSIDDYVERR
jgi:hypothetical protein